MNWILLDIIEALRRTDIVSKSTNWCLMTSHIIVLPFAKESNENVSSELSSQNLCEEVDVGNESSLKDDWDVRSIEQFDWVWLLETSHLSAGQAELNSESLEVDDDHHDNCCSKQVAKVWSILSVECLLKTIKFVWFGDQKVEGGNDGAFELSSLISSNGNWRE